MIEQLWLQGQAEELDVLLRSNLQHQGVKVICVSLSEGSCGSAAEAIRSAGGQAEAMAVDVGNKDSVKKHVPNYSRPMVTLIF